MSTRMTGAIKEYGLIFKHQIHEYSPRTLAGRFLMVMFALVLTSQLLVNHLWERETESERQEALAKVSTNVALRMSATVEYFVNLPAAIRKATINKLRYMGGARYFITLNTEFIKLAPYQNSLAHQTVVNVFKAVLSNSDGNADHISGQVEVAFSRPETLKVLDNQTLLQELPDNWGQETLMVEPLDLPVLVIQVELENSEWLYLATLMPDSSMLSEDYLSADGFHPAPLQTSYLIWMLVLLAFATLAIYFMVRPFEALSKAAKEFGRDLEPVAIPEWGCLEYERTAQAFNQMQKNIRHYMNDRKQLFSGISHDLKTPITRLRLRAEMLDNDTQREAFISDLEHLEIMVKSALQVVSNTDIHENPRVVDLERMLNDITLAAQSVGQRAWLHTPFLNHREHEGLYEITGKPLALKRCLENLIGNAIVYGAPANIYIERVKDQIIITIRDNGPGIPEGMEETIFKPYFRLEYGCQKNPDGNGLGLATARHLAQIHGGSLRLRNHPEGGLVVTLILQTTEFVS
ncbi:ATP-binding protein [Endozoicomonas sp. SCSIO W0465]|uniref:ATP-binding protein n=1 Tax=Endozoicomonas sp. SCSIO W0465 TaxID=2918516 RepID=UPI0020760DE1|nr:ATP-binding protein [Endozoicomonas sp. SCSIO W0465]USE35094.1 ATP-binding protein [Endozoicomonas sp. SCSIO W0465]